MPSEPPSPEPEPPQPDRCEIILQNPGRYAGLDLIGLRSWLAALIDDVAPGARSLGLRFVSDRGMREFNRDYRGRDQPTDVLSFPGTFACRTADDVDPQPENHGGADCAGATQHDAGGEMQGHLGDIAIAVPTARRQASARAHSLAREARLLTLHGVLHCLGHDHETDNGEMDDIESRLRKQWLDVHRVASNQVASNQVASSTAAAGSVVR